MPDVMFHVSQFTESFWAALRNPERRPLARVTYCNLAWEPQEVVTGEITPDSSFAMDEQGHRRVRLRLWNQDGRRTPDPTSEIWFGRFLLDWGLRTSAGEEYVRLGDLVATSMSATAQPAAGWADLGLESPSALWGSFSRYWEIGPNTKIVDAIRAIALDAGENEANLELYPTDEIVGAPFPASPGASRWEHARRLAAATQDVGMILNLTYRPIHRARLHPEVDPATATAPSLELRSGDGIMTELDKRWEANEFANRILVLGGSGSTATILSEIADESSGPYGIARRGDWCYKWPEGQELDPLITTQERADARRDYLYRLKRTSQELISLRGRIIPGLELADVITLYEPTVTRTNANYVLRGGYSFGLGPGGSMTLGARRVVRP